MSKGSRHRSYNDKFRNAKYWQNQGQLVPPKQHPTQNTVTEKDKSKHLESKERLGINQP